MTDVSEDPPTETASTTANGSSTMTNIKEALTPNDDSLSDDTKSLVSSLSERLHFFFSNANLRRDKWMRHELESHGGISLDSLLRFRTIQSISEDRALLVRAARGEDGEWGEALKGRIEYDQEKEMVKRVDSLDWSTLGNGNEVSLYVKNVPVVESEGEVSRYDVTRDEVKALFEVYGRVAIVQLRYERKTAVREKADPLGAAVVEFDDKEGWEKACLDLVPPDTDSEEQTQAEPKTVLELKGKKLAVSKMRASKWKKEKSKEEKDNNDNKEEEQEEESEEVVFEPVTLNWEKGCVISLTGLSSEKCDRESIREAVSKILGVTEDVKTSGLYVDYNRGSTTGNLRLKDANKGMEMKELVDKLNEGTILIAGDKVGSACILQGEEEEKYWKEFTNFLNNKKRQKEEEKAQARKRQKRHNSGGRYGRRGRGRGS